MLNDNSHATAHKMARKLGVDPSTITRHLNNYIGMRCLHLRYVPHKLSSDYKEKSASVIEYFTHSQISKLPHPPYFPDLASCNFGVFETIYDEFKDCSFETEDELIEAVTHFF